MSRGLVNCWSNYRCCISFILLVESVKLEAVSWCIIGSLASSAFWACLKLCSKLGHLSLAEFDHPFLSLSFASLQNLPAFSPWREVSSKDAPLLTSFISPKAVATSFHVILPDWKTPMSFIACNPGFLLNICLRREIPPNDILKVILSGFCPLAAEPQEALCSRFHRMISSPHDKWTNPHE